MATTITILSKALQLVRITGSFSVNFRERSLAIGHESVITGGKCKWDLPSGIDETLSLDATLSVLRDLYYRYRHSVPSQRSERGRHHFVALPLDDLTPDEVDFGQPRLEAELHLELYLLLAVIHGTLRWDEHLLGRHYWQPARRHPFKIERQWIDLTYTPSWPCATL